VPRGFTLPELVAVCTLIAVLAGVALPRTKYLLDGLRLRQAAHEVAGAVTLARAAAIRRGAFAQIVVDEATGTVRVESDGDTLWRRELTCLNRLRATTNRLISTWRRLRATTRHSGRRSPRW
jgi:prepilin-type N-terminal cleavage/methylation domain-containing protein